MIQFLLIFGKIGEERHLTTKIFKRWPALSQNSNQSGGLKTILAIISSVAKKSQIDSKSESLVPCLRED